jgi:hypothetical protein
MMEEYEDARPVPTGSGAGLQLPQECRNPAQ